MGVRDGGDGGGGRNEGGMVFGDVVGGKNK